MHARTLAASAGEATARPLPIAGSYVRYLDWLRGVAILQIVMLHAGNAFILQGLAQRTAASEAALAANHILFHNATVYFSVISGILYAHLFRHRPHGPFLKARLQNVGIPYLVVSGVLTLLLWAMAVRRGDPGGTIDGLGAALVENILTGNAWNTLWYIPVILGLYAISPVLLRIADTPGLRWAAALILALPLAISRTGTELTVSIFVYFMGAYMFGLLVGIRLDRALALFDRYRVVLIVLALASTATLVLLHATGIDMVGITSLRESSYYVQRLAMAALFVLILARWRPSEASRAQAWIGIAAATSFGVYFVHGPILRPVARIVGQAVPQSQPWALPIGMIATFLIGLGLSLALVLLVRRIAGRRSRFVIGS